MVFAAQYLYHRYTEGRKTGLMEVLAAGREEGIAAGIEEGRTAVREVGILTERAQ